MFRTDKNIMKDKEKKKGKDPAFLFYPDLFMDMISDLTFEERGQFITLWCLQFKTGHLTRKSISINIPNISEDVLQKLTLDSNDNYYIQELEDAIKQRKEYSAKQQEKALKRWSQVDARDNNDDVTSTTDDAESMPLHPKDDAKIMPLHPKDDAESMPQCMPEGCLKININKNININKIINNKEFIYIVNYLISKGFLIRGTLSELQIISNWLLVDREIIENSISIAADKDTFDLAYVNGIIRNKLEKISKDSKVPSWFDKEFTLQEITQDEEQELEKILNELTEENNENINK